MRIMLLAALALLFFTPPAFAQKVGDRVAVIAESATLNLDEKEIARIPRGHFLRVEEIKDEAAFVIWTAGTGGTKKGWVAREATATQLEAIKFFDNELKANPSARNYFARGVARLEARDVDGARADLENAVRLDQSSPAYWVSYGQVSFRKDAQEAMRSFEKAIQLDPDYAPAYEMRGRFWDKKKDEEKALADFEMAISLDPDGWLAFNSRAALWIGKGEYAKAITDLTDAIKRAPNNARCYNNRAGAWLAVHNYENALADYNEAIRLQPDDAEYYNWRGVLHLQMNELAKAVSDFMEVKRLDPSHTEVYVNLWLLYAADRDIDSAMDALEEGLQVAPKNARLLACRGSMWIVKEKFLEALKDFETAIESEPKSLEPYYLAVQLLLECKDESFRDVKKARGFATKACEISEWKDAKWLDQLARTHAEAGEFKEAIEWETKAIAAAPENEKREYRYRLIQLESGTAGEALTGEGVEEPTRIRR